MPEISKIGIYHKGINKNYSNLYIYFVIDNFNIFLDSISELVSKLFIEKKVPFETKKQYEVFIYTGYIFENVTGKDQLDNDLYVKAENIRDAFTSLGINTDTVYIFGNMVADNPKIAIEIVEHRDEREIQTFVMRDQYIQIRLKNYYIKKMREAHFQSYRDQLTPKKREKLRLQIDNEFSNSPIAIQDEVDDYMWAVDYCEHDNNYNIILKRNNEHICMFKDSDIRCHSILPKVIDLSIIDRLKEIFERHNNEQNVCTNPSIPIKKANLNTCKYRDLIHIPNFNARMYDDIVLYREEKPFESLDELKNALKIGTTKLNNLKNYFEV